MTTQDRTGERLRLSSASPSLGLWILVLAIGAGTAVMSIQAGSVQWDGLITAALVVGAIALLSRIRGWPFWPW